MLEKSLKINNNEENSFYSATLVMMSANVFADGLTATLQQGDKMTPFYGVDAFKNAYAAADSGAVITLSAGKFNDVSSIEKSVRIVGNFGLDASSVERTILSSLTISANKVSVDGIYFSGNVTLGNINDCIISHSWIEGSLKYLSTTCWHINTIIDQCVLKVEAAFARSLNYLIKNSTIHHFEGYNTTNNIGHVFNSVIYSKFVITGKGTATSFLPYAIYKNNIIAYKELSTTLQGSMFDNDSDGSPREYYYNMFIGCTNIRFSNGCINEGNCLGAFSVLGSVKYPAMPNEPGLGQDGTLRGPFGGTGFSLYPNIPRITSSTIDSSTDNEGKLNVTIKVSVPQ